MVIRLVEGLGPTGNTSTAMVDEAAHWKCSFVNNMPDGAFRETEHQFLELLNLASGRKIIEVRRHTMSGVDRGESVLSHIEEDYRPLSEIKLSAPDIVIVTGSNPIEISIDAEPYWDEMSDLLRWASQNVSTVLLSCLAAHAALLVFDDIARVRLERKCTGVFPQHVDIDHPLGAGIGDDVLMPHSRINSTDAEELRRHGYAIALGSPAQGWSIATKTIDRCDLVLMQAHPEYEPWSLMREYRRDARRFVTRERDARPVLPYHCVAEEDWHLLQDLDAALSPTDRGGELLDGYPFGEVGARAPWPWRSAAKQLYVNWLTGVRIERGETRA